MAMMTAYERLYLLNEWGICLDTKSFKLFGAVDEDMFERTFNCLHYLNQSVCKITLYLNTSGGSVSYAKAIYDLIKNSANFVSIVCVGEVFSAGTLILMAGDERYMSENSLLMLHTGEESYPSDKPRNIDSLYNQNRIDEEFMYEIYLERMNDKKRKDKKKLIEIDEVKELLVNDTYINAKKALQLGLITNIGLNNE